MKNKNLQTPAIIIAIGLVLSLVVCLVTNIVLTPAVAEHDFNYSVTYQLNGETKTLEGIYTCRYDGYGEGENPRDRSYIGEYTIAGQTTQSLTNTIAQNSGAELYLVVRFNSSYLMGDTKNDVYVPFLDDPYLEAIDAEGYPYDEAAMSDLFDAEIISWEYPEPIENTFVFSGFSILHSGSMVAMLVIGLLTILACMIFVKRDKTVPYKALDKISIVLNFVICLVAIPFTAIATALLQITMSGTDPVYQLLLCVPALAAFALAASIALRRKNFTKSGFFLQFVGPVLFVLLLVLDSAL